MPARRTLFIHAGLPKTGTSFLQGVFFGSRAALAEQDFALLPADQGDHLRVTLSIRNMLQEFDTQFTRNCMHRLTRQAEGNTRSRALFTHESLAPCRPEQAQLLLDAVGEYDVHLIVTTRDPGRQIPSAWQQRMQARGTFTYEQFVDAVFERTELASDFWWNQDLVDVLRRWSQVIPPSQIHVITCPPPGSPPTLLLERFCGVVGVDPSTLSLEHRVDNVALGQAQAELLRRVNVALGDRFPHIRDGYRRLGQVFLAGQVLRPQAGRPAQLPASRREDTEQLAEDWMKFLSEGGYDVIGDLDELRPLDQSFEATPSPVSTEDLVDVAATAIADILEKRDEELNERAELLDRIGELEEALFQASGGRAAARTLLRQARKRLSRG